MARTQIEEEGFNAGSADWLAPSCVRAVYASRPYYILVLYNVKYSGPGRKDLPLFYVRRSRFARTVPLPQQPHMLLLHYLSYVAAIAAFAFVTLSLASGLLYISELIEEHSRFAKLVGQRGTYAIITLHVFLCFTDSLPVLQATFSIICHIIYLQNFSSQWPLISLSSASFIASCAMAILNHFMWFMYFSSLTRDARQPYRRRGPVPDIPGFTDIATFFGICVWIVPLFLFLSLSANDNALPTSGIFDPSSASLSSHGAQHSKSSLFKSMFSVFYKDKIVPLDRPNRFINPSPPSTHPMPSPSALPSPFSSPPPRSQTISSHASQHEASSTPYPHSRFPRRSSESFRGMVNMNTASRRIASSGGGRHASE